MKKAVILVLTTVIGTGVVICAGSVHSSPKAITDWSKVKPDMNILLKMVPTPPSTGNTLIDGAGAKSDCHLVSMIIDKGKPVVTEWTCWGENGNSFPKIPTKWSKIKPDLNIFSRITPTPPSVGNMLIDSKRRQHDCHLTSSLKNDEGETVAGWACWPESVVR